MLVHHAQVEETEEKEEMEETGEGLEEKEEMEGGGEGLEEKVLEAVKVKVFELKRQIGQESRDVSELDMLDLSPCSSARKPSGRGVTGMH